MIIEGHQIANHSFDHSGFLSEGFITENSNDLCKFMKDQMKRSSDTFQKYLGVSPSYFRPPYGEINSEIQSILHYWGYRVILWNLDTRDWYWDDKGRDVNQIVQEYKNELDPEPKNKSYISLQHDKGRNDIMENHIRYNKIIKLIREKGFHFVTLEECMDAPKSKYFTTIPDFEKCN